MRSYFAIKVGINTLESSEFEWDNSHIESVTYLTQMDAEPKEITRSMIKFRLGTMETAWVWADQFLYLSQAKH